MIKSSCGEWFPQDDFTLSFGGSMDIFSQAIEGFARLPRVGAWVETKRLFEVAASRKPAHWLIPVRACESVGSSQERTIPTVVAIGCAHVGILLVDDMLDDDPRGDFRQLGMPAASNLACFFQAAALHALSECTPRRDSRLAAMKSFNEMYLTTAFGQSLDVQAPATESGYWEVAKSKSSPFFGAALQLGALAGDAPIQTAEGLMEVGKLYGEMIQIHDDMHDSMETPANPDWLLERSPLPILFASLVPHPDQARFLKLKKQTSSPDALQEAQEILIHCGAISYCADQLMKRHKAAIKKLDEIPLAKYEPISALFDQLIAPVDNLLKAGERTPLA
jgi:geranylgeranyl pyrophosphate synthase